MSPQQRAFDEWSAEFRRMCPADHGRALEYASDPDLCVDIIRTDETGEVQWVIVPEVDPEFWLDSFASKTAALTFCRKIGWRLL